MRLGALAMVLRRRRARPVDVSDGRGRLPGDGHRRTSFVMCGRATLTASPEDIRDIFEVDAVPAMPPRFNIAPSQPLLVLKVPHKLEVLTWASKFVNAKVETATTRPENRCLVVIDGFYEW